MSVPRSDLYRQKNASDQRLSSVDLNSQIIACAVFGASLGACYGFIQTLKHRQLLLVPSVFAGTAIGPVCLFLHQSLEDRCPQIKVLNAFATGRNTHTFNHILMYHY